MAICHYTSRSTDIDGDLGNSGTLERAPHQNHASTRTTQRCDRRSDKATLDYVERIRFG
jgi:hypothetical protein